MNRLDHDEVRLGIQAPPELLWDLVSDVTRTPQWSPEVVSCRWQDGAAGPEPGARFKARNKRRWFTWSNTPVVETAEPGRQFAFTRTEPGGGTIRWSYRLQAGPGGTTTTELGYQVLKPVPVLLHLILGALLGVRDLRADLRQNMTHSLQELAGIAEPRPSRHPPAAATDVFSGAAARAVLASLACGGFPGCWCPDRSTFAVMPPLSLRPGGWRGAHDSTMWPGVFSLARKNAQLRDTR